MSLTILLRRVVFLEKRKIGLPETLVLLWARTLPDCSHDRRIFKPLSHTSQVNVESRCTEICTTARAKRFSVGIERDV